MMTKTQIGPTTFAITHRKSSGRISPVRENIFSRFAISPTVIEAEPASVLHRDLWIPFGETLGDNAVEQDLRQVAGKEMNTNSIHWHEYFEEDTKQGTRCRVLASVARGADPARAPSDLRLPLETSALALAQKLAEARGAADFQFLLFHDQEIISVIFQARSPLHVLRLNLKTETAPAERLKKQAASALASANLSGLKCFLPGEILGTAADVTSGDDFWDAEGFTLADFGLEAELGTPAEPGAGSAPGSRPAFRPGSATGADEKSLSSLLLHWGLALAAADPLLSRHNSATAAERETLKARRAKWKMWRNLALAASAGLLLLLAQLGLKSSAAAELAFLEAKAGMQTQAIARNAALQQEISAASQRLAGWRPLWTPPLNGAKVLGLLGAALPAGGTLDGLELRRDTGAVYEIRMRVQVKDWDDVTRLGANLGKTPGISALDLSGQQGRENGRVEFLASFRYQGCGPS